MSDSVYKPTDTQYNLGLGDGKDSPWKYLGFGYIPTNTEISDFTKRHAEFLKALEKERKDGTVKSQYSEK